MKTTFTRSTSKRGSSRQYINIMRDNAPLGQIWTYPDTGKEQHPWTVKLLGEDKPKFFWPEGGYSKADTLAIVKEWVINS